MARKRKLPEKDLGPMYDALKQLPPMVMEGEDFYTLSDVNGLFINFYKWLAEDDSRQLLRKRGIKTDKEVDVIEFAESEEYMNLKGSLYPAVKEALYEIWHGDTKYMEVVLTGSIGIGKSWITDLSCAYTLYKLAILWEPQAELDLAPGSQLYLVFQGRTLDQAKAILFRPFVDKVRVSPFFQKYFPFDKETEKSELIFPNGIHVKPFSGSDNAVIGLNVVWAGVTELNRMAYVEHSTRSKSAEDFSYDQAVTVYKKLINRMASRTMQVGGGLWGKIFLDAAYEHEDDFTSKKVKEAQENKKIYVYSKAHWEVRPDGSYSGEKFLVEVGDANRKSRILKSHAEAVDGAEVIEIPIEYYDFFKDDVEGGLKEFGARVLTTERPAIPYREKILKASEDFKKLSGVGQLFSVDSIAMQDLGLDPFMDDYAWDDLINHRYLEEVLIDKEAILCGHYDPALNHDVAGLALGHIYGWKILPMVKKFNPRTKEYEEHRDVRAPMLMIDGLLQIVYTRGEEIPIEMVQNFVIYLSSIMNLQMFSVDSYQSAQMIQAWREAGIATGVVSTVTTTEPFTRVKLAYRDERLIHPYHEVYDGEIRKLQFNGKQYDHPNGGSKDVADSAAGTIYLLETHIVDFVPGRRPVPGSAKRLFGRTGRRLSMRKRV